MPKNFAFSHSSRASDETSPSGAPARRPPRRDTRELAKASAIAVLGLAFLLFSVLLKAELRRGSATEGGLSAGERVPPLELPSMGGDAVELAEVLERHRLVAVVFWASWCPPCRVELHRLAVLDLELGEPFGVIAVNIDVDREAVQREVTDGRIAFPVLLDPERQMAERFAVQVLPTTFLIGSDGEVRQVHEGFSRSLPTQVKSLLGADGV